MEGVKIREWIRENIGIGQEYLYDPVAQIDSEEIDGVRVGNGCIPCFESGILIDCLAAPYGNGCGLASGHGDTNNLRDGRGEGYGGGYAQGSGSLLGDGEGYGTGIQSHLAGIGAINGNPIWLIDETATVITAICRNIAKGYIVNRDLTLAPCFIAKGQGYFAHGETAKKAVEALQEKIFEEMDPEESIEAFMAEFEPKKKYPAMDFYTWHHRLTGSCEMGRKQFFKDRGYDIEHDTFSVEEFIRITENAYGGEIIRQLKEAWKRKWHNE